MDFTSVYDYAIIPAGQTSVTVTVPILGDTQVEGDEVFDVRLIPTGGVGLCGVGLSNTDATVTIVDDDGAPLSVASVSPTGSGVARTAAVTATFSSGVPQTGVSLTLMTGKKAVRGTLRCNSATACTTASFTPSTQLARATTYTATVRASDGTTNVSSTWSFTTGR